ncbi:MAG: chloride channel protein [Bacteroidia bacterium]|nr:chloride channel protein [Bacteroidia bacterium]
MNLKFHEAPINWIHQKLNKRQFLIFSSMLVGLTAGLAAVILKTIAHYINDAITYNYNIKYQYYLYLFFPLIGIVLTVYIVKRFLHGKLGRGTANVLHGIIKKSAFLPKDQMFSHVITSAFTVGFGGSAGLESPMVTTGSAIGSNYARTYHLSYKDRVLLLASGAAAGIAAAFNSPIAGVLFALEVLLADISISAFIPLIIAAAIGALCSKIILQEGILLSFHYLQPFNYTFVPFYALLGLLAGLVSVYYARTYTRIENKLNRNKEKVYSKALVGGLILAALIFLFPPLFGEGYSSIMTLSEKKTSELMANSLFADYSTNEWVVLFFIGAAMLIKVVATSVTINSGGNGGNFAPSLFVGAFLGYFFARLITLLGITHLPEGNFTIVAMSGILSGIFHAPLTAIFLIVEITGGYELMIPLMIVSALSFTVVKYFEPYSMDVKKLAKKGHVLTYNKDKSILASLKISTIIETDFHKVSPETKLGELIEVVAHSKRNIFPVVNETNQLLGIILLDNIREVMFKTELYDNVFAKELMRQPATTVTSDEPMHAVMRKFDETGAWNLPVIDHNQYIGFISKSSIFSKYRKVLIKSNIA